METIQTHKTVWEEDLKEIDRLKNLSVDMRKTLTWILINRIGWFGLDSSASTMEQMVAFCR